MQTADTTKQLGTAPIGKMMFRLALPAIAAQVVNLLYNIVDRMYIGHIETIGATALTGVGVTFSVIMIISAFGSLIGMGGAPRASIKMGQKDDEGAEQVLGNCFVTLIGISVVLTVIFLIFQKDMLMLFGASKDTIGYAMDYLGIYVCGTIFVQIALGLNMFITSQGFALMGMLTVLIGAVLNIALDPVLIFGLNMGVKGAALATVFSQAVSAAWVLAFLCGKKTKLRLRVRNFRLRGKVILPVLALGVSPFIMQSTESLLNICFNSSLQRYGGDVAVGAMTVLTSLMQVYQMPLMGLTQGVQPIVSYNYGAKNYRRVRKAIRLLLIVAMIFSLVFWLAVQLFPQVFVRMFNDDPSLVDTASWALRIYMALVLLLGAQTACQQSFIAIGQAKISLFLALLRKIILLIPLIYLIPLFLEDKVFAVFLAEPVADFLAVATTVTLFALRIRKLLPKQDPEESPVSNPIP